MKRAFLFPSAALNDRIEIGQEGGEEDWLGACKSPQENQYAHCSLQLTYQHMPATSAWWLKQSAGTTGTLAKPCLLTQHATWLPVSAGLLHHITEYYL